ncbi:hypothetical protein [Devosia sp.]|uniref:hypothetical protein n=1 Tax=Devosia sp. TaxID=1871048 RepID=UPI001ACBAF17|nr:hypothetical protein [Devosia sp.]MBN9304663.1 hypothetical protein [Devosia sp.]
MDAARRIERPTLGSSRRSAVASRRPQAMSFCRTRSASASRRASALMVEHISSAQTYLYGNLGLSFRSESDPAAG